MRTKGLSIIISFIVLIFMLVSCSVANQGKIYIEGYEKEDSVLNLTIGTPEYSNYKVIYENGTKKEEAPLEASMISNYDRMKFYQVGEFKITISAYDLTCTLAINVSRNAFRNYSLVNEQIVYDGEYHSLSFNKALPAGTDVTYDIGNSFKDVGMYIITATLTNDSYISSKLTGTLTITEANYDMSGITFKDTIYTYDGKYKTLQIEGDLPSGLSVSYEIEGYTSGRVMAAGEYNVTATFVNSDSNFFAPEAMTAKLFIEKATYDMSGVLFPDAVYDYDGNPKRPKLTGEIPEGVTVEYTVINANTANIIEDYRSVTERGTYYFFAEFFGDSTNYYEINALIATLEIK